MAGRGLAAESADHRFARALRAAAVFETRETAAGESAGQGRFAYRAPARALRNTNPEGWGRRARRTIN